MVVVFNIYEIGLICICMALLRFKVVMIYDSYVKLPQEKISHKDQKIIMGAHFSAGLVIVLKDETPIEYLSFR